MKSEDLCSIAHCRKLMFIIAFGKPLCDDHNAERIDRAYEAARTATQGSNTAGVIRRQGR